MTQIRGIDNLVKKLNKLGGNGKELVRDSLAKNINMVRDQAVMLCPPGSSGDLQNSIKTKVEETSTSVVATCYTNMEYAAYVEFGTGPIGEANHDGISPELNISYRSNGWSYMDEKTGEFIHTKGQAAQPFLYPALKDIEDDIIDEIKEDLREELRRLSND